MDIDHVHFYVDDAKTWRNWFIETLGCEAIAHHHTPHTHTEIVQRGGVCLALSSPLTPQSEVATYLQRHPPGVVDIAFRVADIKAAIAQFTQHHGILRVPLQTQTHPDGQLQWAIAQGWGDLRHTLLQWTGTPTNTLAGLRYGRSVQPMSAASSAPSSSALSSSAPSSSAFSLTGIDHAVLNVDAGDLSTAIAWYENAFGFRRQQGFTIQTAYSGLSSQVLVHPQGRAQLPINEPLSPSSQIQEFLDCNRGSGIQHVALQTDDSLRAIADLRQRGLTFLPVPPSYYGQLRQRADFWLGELQWQAIAAQQLLIDWQPHSQALLLQAFTQPIFAIPTFFFEIIERRPCQLNQNPAQGFGEGNFRALFEAVEREQRKRTQPL